MLRRGVKIFQNNKIKEREHSNKWDPSERFFKKPLLWGISSCKDPYTSLEIVNEDVILSRKNIKEIGKICIELTEIRQIMRLSIAT